MRALVLTLCLLGAACGTTRIVSADRNATIIVDGKVMGRGSVELTRRGTPRTMTVEVRARDGRRAVRSVSRKFSGTTFVAGLFTYGIGMLTFWELPEEVYIDLPESSWDEGVAADDDPWAPAKGGAGSAATSQWPSR